LLPCDKRNRFFDFQPQRLDHRNAMDHSLTPLAGGGIDFRSMDPWADRTVLRVP
jgi:hypothetical protein